jgi:hypothetical protein
VKASLELGSDDRRVDLGGSVLALDQARGDDAHRVEARVGAIDVGLFGIEIWMGHPCTPGRAAKAARRSIVTKRAGLVKPDLRLVAL